MEREHTPPQQWLVALDELAHLSAQAWRKWLQHGVAVWSPASPNADRVGAFAPIVLNPRDPGPPQLAEALQQRDFAPLVKQLVENAIAAEISTWCFPDEPDRACFLLELAGWFGCAQIEVAVRALLSRPIHLTGRSRDRLAASLAFALCRRAGPSTALALGRRMKERELECKPALFQIIAYAATANTSSLPRLVVEFLPHWIEESPSSPLARMLADQLVDQLGLEAVAKIVLASGDKVLSFLRAIVQTNRLKFEGEGDADTVVFDRLRMHSVKIARGLEPQPPKHAPWDYLGQQFAVRPLGDLGLEDMPTAGSA